MDNQNVHNLRTGMTGLYVSGRWPLRWPVAQLLSALAHCPDSPTSAAEQRGPGGVKVYRQEVDCKN